jgi:hypothetical protein
VKYPQIAQQGPIVNGIDTDAFFGTLDQLKKYGYHAPAAPAPQPAPQPTPSPEPTPVPTPPPVTPPVVVDSPELTLEKENNGLLKQILALLQSLVNKINGVFK